MGNSVTSTDNAGGTNDVRLYTEIRPEQWPIIYSPEYDISFAGLERLHPFDSCKWSKVYRFLLGESELYAAQCIASLRAHTLTARERVSSTLCTRTCCHRHPLRVWHDNEGHDNRTVGSKQRGIAGGPYS